MNNSIDNNNVADLLGDLDKLKQPTILAVDDIEDNLDLIVEIFEDEPFNILTAQSAKQAWGVLKHNTPDLVLLDIQMPDIDGFELCTAIRQQPGLSHLPVIFLTAKKTDEQDVASGLKLGANDYVCKPFERDVLLARVRATLRRAARQRRSD